jgi:hypothetical protein
MDPDDHEPAGAVVPVGRTRRELTALETRQIIAELLTRLEDRADRSTLQHGALTAVSKLFHVCPRTIKRTWERAIQNHDNPHVGVLRASPQKNQVARNKKWNTDELREAVKAVPLHQRRSLRLLSGALEVPLSTLHRMRKNDDDQVIRPHTSVLRPLLTNEHQFQRVCYAAMHLNRNDYRYDDFYQHVHVDEKWFYLTEQQMRMYLAPDEPVPLRVSQKKSDVMKVMFLAAIARPRYNDDGECTFDGKIGMWPFVERKAAQRGSINRPAGTIETKAIGVTRTVYRRMLIDRVVPAIKEKWPDLNRDIVLQQDGASAHIKADDLEFGITARQGLWNINILTQAPKSPDTNICDLSFFRALQSEQWRSGEENTIDGLIAQVLAAFVRFDARKNDFGFITLQCCLDDILIRNGGNDYSIRHMGKERMLREGILPVRVQASDAAIASYNFFMEPPAHLHDSESSSDEDAGDDDAAAND